MAALLSLSLLASPPSVAETRWTIESGFVVGGAIDLEGPTHSHYRAILDLGFLDVPDDATPVEGSRSAAPSASDRDPGRRSPATRGWGLVAHGSLGREDMRLGLKSRVRFPIGSAWGMELSAGPLVAALEGDLRVSGTGFVGGASLQRGRSLSLRADVHVVHVDAFTIGRDGIPVPLGPGHEVSLYGGLTFRDRAGWAFTGAGLAVLATMTALVIAAGS